MNRVIQLFFCIFLLFSMENATACIVQAKKTVFLHTEAPPQYKAASKRFLSKRATETDAEKQGKKTAKMVGVFTLLSVAVLGAGVLVRDFVIYRIGSIATFAAILFGIGTLVFVLSKKGDKKKALLSIFLSIALAIVALILGNNRAQSIWD